MLHGAEAVVVLDHVARAAQRLVPGRGKAKKSGELHSQPGKVVTERGEGEYTAYLEIKGNKVVSH